MKKKLMEVYQILNHAVPSLDKPMERNITQCPLIPSMRNTELCLVQGSMVSPGKTGGNQQTVPASRSLRLVGESNII